MKKLLKIIPEPLQKEILLRLIGCILGAFLLFVFAIVYKDWRFWLPCGILSVIWEIWSPFTERV